MFLNSGIQRGFDFSKPESVDISTIQTEFTTNYLSYIALMKGFLPFLQSQKSETALIWYARGPSQGAHRYKVNLRLSTTSGLALVPMVRCPNYCATKAALHMFVLALRKQLEGSNVKVIEIFPPAVQSKVALFSHVAGTNLLS